MTKTALQTGPALTRIIHKLTESLINGKTQQKVEAELEVRKSKASIEWRKLG